MLVTLLRIWMRLEVLYVENIAMLFKIHIKNKILI